MDIHRILQHIRPGEEWSLSGNDYNKLEWLSKTTKPTLEEIKSAWSEVQDKLKTKINNAEIEKQINSLVNKYIIALASGDTEDLPKITAQIKALKAKLS